MSFRNYKDKIEEGDTAILYLSNNLYAIDVRPEMKNKKGEIVENVYQTPFGALKVRTLIGANYGSRVELSKGWGHVIQPTPELWSLTLPHRTQIIYTPDISMILLQLDLVPGSIVIEAGTGSGSLTHALIRRVRPHGHVHTFDFHEHRSKVAQEEFQEHGIADFVTAKHRDVLADGFGEELNGKADAVFLDLPSPWIGVPHKFEHWAFGPHSRRTEDPRIGLSTEGHSKEHFYMEGNYTTANQQTDHDPAIALIL
ncbi:hypothetical protein HW555_009784 [Spodoptera exigua]|uniref:tRNA (adenine(58)-N(1))-methyltransferase n=1 Tax=Spodoptera exigua TaxID=7107 RepID=A0A835GA13_SPOEX|nr:hypothetical protein HW555_009784 [Spodoptera exigua]